MNKKLEKKGNSHYLLIQKAWLQLIGANPDQEFEIEVKKGSIIITPIKETK